jgi:two-component system, chemotaxis family, chemotaxis protein CheY
MNYNFHRLKVLIVDDNQHMRTLVSAVLQAFGVSNVYEARNGDEAWKVLLKVPCDIVLLDWLMTGMNGLELTQKIRSAPDSTNPFVPIVMLTGHTSVESVNAARDAGVNEFLAKPVSSKTILNRLVSVIEHPRPFVRTRGYFGPCRRRREIVFHGPDRREAGAEPEFIRNPANAA